MANNNIPFEFVGKLSIGKESDKFKPYENTDYPSGWTKRKLKFNLIAGDNRHMLTIDGGCYKDGHGEVYLFSKGTVDESGTKTKGESFTIPFKERMTSPRLAEVAEFKKFVVDTEISNRRYKLEKAIEKRKDGKAITDEELKEIGVENENDIDAEFEKSKKKRHEYVSEYDFAEFVNKLISSDKYKDKKFKVLGNHSITYSDKNQKFYTSYIPNRIYLANDDEPEVSNMTLTMMFNKGSLDSGSIEDKGKYYVNGYVFQYDSARRKTIPCPVTVVIPAGTDEHTKKIAGIYVKQFTVDDDSWKEIGVKISVLDGAQKTEITEDMLSELQQELLLLGEITMDDIRKEMGGSAYGDRIQELEFEGLAKGYTKGRKDTVYLDEDFVIKPLNDSPVDKETADLFDDDEDI